MFFSKTFSTQNECVEHLLTSQERLSLPELKNYKWNGKDAIASHSKIVSNVRKKLRKQGRDIACYELHTIDKSSGRLVSNHTAYEIVDRVLPKTKIISTQYV